MIEKQQRHILLVSGGKDSTALALYMRDKRPDIEFEYLFCDTHKELPETYEYLARIEAYLGRPITRLSSGLGERGFDHFLKIYGGYLPSPKMRWCTRQLKIEPFERHVGDDPVLLYVGIRADERRSGYISTKENITPVFPFKDDGLTKADIVRILEESGVGLPKYYEWRSRSGCYFCFFQQRAEWVRLRERHPDLFEEAKGYEKEEEGYTWTHGESLSELEQPQRVQQVLAKEQVRRDRLARRRRVRNLSEAFGFSDPDPIEGDGCLICHL
jgi:3'-phosphoadenosine 5'-phosphosulfate sulfotransferase (PAPS reductase)/FAD synthetase